MYVNNLGLNNVAKNVPTTQEAAKDGSKLGKDEFMKLLMQQMRSQDPLSPQNNSESIAQMAQFSSLEQSTNLNNSFKDLSRMMTMNSLASSAHVIGKYATVQDGSEEVSGKVVSTSLKEGEVLIKLQAEDGKEITAKLGSIISLSEKPQEKKEYKVLPGNEALTEA
jgi:flagellar basal-body rod modification protein FlgD